MALESDTHAFGLVSASSQPCGFIQTPGHSRVSVSLPGKPCCSPREGAVKSLAPVPSPLEETLVSVVLVEEDHEVPSHPAPHNCRGSLIVQCPEPGLAGRHSHQLVLGERGGLTPRHLSLLPLRASNPVARDWRGFLSDRGHNSKTLRSQTLKLFSGVTLDKLLNLSVPQVLRHNGDNSVVVGAGHDV